MPTEVASSDPALLDVVDGNDQGRTFELPNAFVMIGRGAQCDFVLADLAVSRKHLAVEFDGQGYILLDQGSGNGTKVNGVRVQSHRLEEGDLIQAGKTQLVFRWPGAGQNLARGGSDTRPTEPFDGLGAAVLAQSPPRSAPSPRSAPAARPAPSHDRCHRHDRRQRLDRHQRRDLVPRVAAFPVFLRRSGSDPCLEP